jgi:hypothetical protein
MLSQFHNAFSLKVDRLRTHAPPARSLDFDVTVKSGLDETVVLLGSRVRVLLGNIEVAEGDLLYSHHAPARGSVIAGRDEFLATINVPLSREAIGLVEGQRVGDLEYVIDATLTLAPLHAGPPEVMGKPWPQLVESRSGQRIAQSEWLRHLRHLGWDETTLFELPAGRGSYASPAAQKRWEEAVEHYRQGNWEETLVSCRKLFESLAVAKSDANADRADPRKLREYFDSTKKGDALNDMQKQFTEFLHMGRHDQTAGSGIRIDRDDALLALTISSGLLRYMSR